MIKVWAEKSKFSALLDADEDGVDLASDEDDEDTTQQEEEKLTKNKNNVENFKEQVETDGRDVENNEI